MSTTPVSVRLDDQQLAALDARAQREGLSRAALVEFAIKPLLKNDEVRVLDLPTPAMQMLERIAEGQKVHVVDVMRRALVDYAGRAAERWQVNARADERPPLHAVASKIRDEHGIRPYEGN